MKVTFYSGKKDGDIKDFLIESRDRQVPLAFKGPEPFEQLWELGVVTPEITSIRLVYGSGADGFYMVKDKEHVEGISVPPHGGLPGIHNTLELLAEPDMPPWVIDSVNSMKLCEILDEWVTQK